jgi:hypothetical protein
VVSDRYRKTRTSFAGGWGGVIYNDLQFLSDPPTSRITQITGRTPSTVAQLQVRVSSRCVDLLATDSSFLSCPRSCPSLHTQTTYTSRRGANILQETPVRGSDGGNRTTFTVAEGEYITRVQGRHDGAVIHKLQVTTDRDSMYRSYRLSSLFNTGSSRVSLVRSGQRHDLVRLPGSKVQRWHADGASVHGDQEVSSSDFSEESNA